MFTIITMYRGSDAETFCQLVEGKLSEEQRQKWRDAHNCLTHDEINDRENEGEDMDDAHWMFFREIDVPVPNGQLCDLLNVDG